MRRLFLVTSLLLVVLAAAEPPPAVAASKVFAIQRGKSGFGLNARPHIACDGGKWILHFSVRVRGVDGKNYPMVSVHGSFEDADEFLEFLRTKMDRVFFFETLPVVKTQVVFPEKKGEKVRLVKRKVYALRAIHLY